MNRAVVVVGAGGHGRVVADMLLCAGSIVHGFVDADPRMHGAAINGITVLGDDKVLDRLDRERFDVAIGVGTVGPSTARASIVEGLIVSGWRLAPVVHPRATVSRHAVIERGAQVMAGAVVQPGAYIGLASIINTSASIDHDCRVGARCHIAPGATLSGGVEIGDDSHVGTGATIIHGIRLGPRTMVAAGAVVVKDDPGSAVLIGVPARRRLA